MQPTEKPVDGFRVASFAQHFHRHGHDRQVPLLLGPLGVVDDPSCETDDLGVSVLSGLGAQLSNPNANLDAGLAVVAGAQQGCCELGFGIIRHAAGMHYLAHDAEPEGVEVDVGDDRDIGRSGLPNVDPGRGHGEMMGLWREDEKMGEKGETAAGHRPSTRCYLYWTGEAGTVLGSHHRVGNAGTRRP